ncbi:MAG: hypothetical protein QGD92_10345 [Gammaproteobacteria bacterium]|nr:hypothetical protein [Gammaproteobacteria bacterium]
MDDDVCMMQIGFMRAHFTGYLPSVAGNEEFCEDIPEVAGSIFVIDYLHDYLRQMEVDFRIVKDSHDLGVYARWEDIAVIEDLERDTVFYQPPLIKADGVLTVAYEFTEAGNYIGIVTAKHPEKQKTYHAVFPFTVGGTSMGYLPWIIFLAVFVQGFYWLSNGGFKKILGSGMRMKRREESSELCQK